MNSEEIVKISANALNDKKAKDLQVLSVADLTALTEYFVIATATSSTHVRALADEVEEKLQEAGQEVDHIEGKSTGWMVLDYKSVIVHIFTPDRREFYDLDKMWSNAQKTDLDKILNEAQGD